MDAVELKKSYWKEAAFAGMIMGLFMMAVELMRVLVGFGLLWSLVEVVGLAWLIYHYTKKRGDKYGSLGFTYGQSFGFIIACMLFTGVIYGFGEFVFQNILFKEHYAEIYAELADTFERLLGMDYEVAESMAKTMHNPISMIFGGVFTMILYGGVIGLFASAFLKRKPDVFAPDNQL